MNYIPQTIIDQAETIKKYLGITMSIPETVPLLPEKAEHYFLIPKWNRIGKTYVQACNAVIAAIKKQRDGKTYQWVEFTEDNLRPLKRDVPEIIAAQFGELHKGESVRRVRNSKDSNEALLGLYEICVMVLTHPDRIKSYDDLWIDCAGDEFAPAAGGAFSKSPVFFFFDRAEFDTKDVDRVREYYGAASFFFPQSKVESGILEPFENSLSLESAINTVKEAGYKIFKEI